MREKNINSVFQGLKTRTEYPSNDLIPYIEKYVFYRQEKNQDQTCFRMLPNGKVEIFINLVPCSVRTKNDTHFIPPRASIIGITNLLNDIRIIPEPNSTDFKSVFVTLTLNGVVELLGCTLSKLTNRIISLDKVLGYQAGVFFSKLQPHSTTESFKNKLNHFFQSILAKKKNVLVSFKVCMSTLLKKMEPALFRI